MTVNALAGIGTCVETLNSDGTRLEEGTTDQGNFAICHWFYYAGSNNTAKSQKGGADGTDWGETRILTEEQWGNGGSVLTGASMQGSGTRLDATYNGFTLGGTVATYSSTSFYTMSWYQPPYAASYPAGHLRRYSGNA